jgi:hypothetical protein
MEGAKAIDLDALEARMERERNLDKTTMTHSQAIWALGESYADRLALITELRALREQVEHLKAVLKVTPSPEDVERLFNALYRADEGPK